MRRILGSIFVVLLLVLAIAGPATAAGAEKYTWDSPTTPYAGPAGMIVNNAGAIVWWHVPGDTQYYKDIYRFDYFDGAAPYPTASLNQPVRDIMVDAFPNEPLIWYTREPVDGVPNLGNADHLE